MSTLTLPQVNHVGISVRDLAVAVRFWIEGLGARDHGAFGWPVGTKPADESLATRDTSAQVQLLRTDCAFLELFAFESPAPAPRLCDAPGVRTLVWGAVDVPALVESAVAHGGVLDDASGVVLRCPDGVRIECVEVAPGGEGLVGVKLAVAEAASFAFGAVRGPVSLEVHSGASSVPAAAVDLGVNHLCLDVHDAAAHRSQRGDVRWHHEVTESSGGLAAVCYGTTRDGVLVELLESRSPEAFLARERLSVD